MSELVSNAQHAELTRSYWSVGIDCFVSTLSAKLSWGKIFTQLCSRRVSDWRGIRCWRWTRMTSDDMKVSKGLKFPVVALPGVGHMPTKGEDEQEAARLFNVAALRATQRLVIRVKWDGKFGSQL